MAQARRQGRSQSTCPVLCPAALSHKQIAIVPVQSCERMLGQCPHRPSPCAPCRPSAVRLADWRAVQQRRSVQRAAKAATAKSQKPSTAKEAVETGLELFQQGQTEEALRLFSAAADLQPKQEELRAAEYNKACALVKLKRWQEAADAIVQAVNEHGEDIQTALKVWHCMLHRCMHARMYALRQRDSG